MYFALIALMGFVALLLFVAVWRALAELFVRLALGITLAAVLGISADLAAANIDYDGLLTGTLFAMTMLVPCITWVGRRRSDTQLSPVISTAPIRAEAAKATPTSIEQHSGLANAAELASAWDEAARLLPGGGLEPSREACARFMAAAAAEPTLDASVIELTVLIRKQVPGLVGDTRAVIALAEAGQADDAIASFIRELRALGDEAVMALVEMRAHAGERLSIWQSHLRSRRTARERSF